MFKFSTGTVRDRSFVLSRGSCCSCADALDRLSVRVHAPAAAHANALSLVCAGVLLTLFVLTLPSFLRSSPGEDHVGHGCTGSERARCARQMTRPADGRMGA